MPVMTNVGDRQMSVTNVGDRRDVYASFVIAGKHPVTSFSGFRPGNVSSDKAVWEKMFGKEVLTGSHLDSLSARFGSSSGKAPLTGRPCAAGECIVRKVLIAVVLFATCPVILAQQTLTNNPVVKLVKADFSEDHIEGVRASTGCRSTGWLI